MSIPDYLQLLAKEIDQQIFDQIQQFKSVYENEEENPPGENPPGENPPGENPPGENPPAPKPGKTFSQDDVNRMLADDRRKKQKERDQLITELKTLRDGVHLTDQQKESLETRIEQLQNETLTVKELANKEKEKQAKEFEKEKTKLVNDNTFWRTQYSEEKIVRELQDAAIENKAISSQQIVNFLKPNTKLVEELKDGKPTGKWVPKVTFADKDDKGENITLELSVTEAVKRMSEMNEHWNLFNSGAISGTGGFNMGNNGGVGYRGKKPPKDPIEYAKWRKENVGR